MAHRDSLAASVSIDRLFQRRLTTLEFAPKIDTCPSCDVVLLVRKSRMLRVATLNLGTFRAHETVLYCPKCNTDYHSEELLRLKPSGSRFGYDVLVHAGKQMFLGCRCEREIQQELQSRQVVISEREVTYLAWKFVVYLSVAHRESREQLRQLLHCKGGYILHLDATCEGDSPHLMTAMDGITEIVLENVKLASERADRIVPLLRRIKELYGDPLGSVHDMGKGICKALPLVFPNIADFICHYHFLADTGEDLFGQENDTIRKRLRRNGVQGKLRKRVQELSAIVEENPSVVESLSTSLADSPTEQRMNDGSPALMPAVETYTLVLWALEGKKHTDGYGFPFDRPYLIFYERLEVLRRILRHLNRQRLAAGKQDNKPYVRVLRNLIDTMDDTGLRKAAGQMQEKITVFDKLREAMRIAIPTAKHGLNDRGSKEKISSIKKRVEEFRHWLCNDEMYSKQQDYKGMISQLDKYWDKLFCDPILVAGPQGPILVQPQRTNNGMLCSGYHNPQDSGKSFWERVNHAAAA